jgi:hypothetical protein
MAAVLEIPREAIETYESRVQQINSAARLIAHRGAEFLTRDELSRLPVPDATRTFKPIPHVEVVNALVETLGFRHLRVVREQYAATPDGAKMFGAMEIDVELTGLRFALGIRNSNDKSFRLAVTVGYRVFVCDNLAFQGDFSPLLAKHSHNTNLIDLVSVGVDRIQRNFRPIMNQIEAWQTRIVGDDEAKRIIYAAFIERRLKAPAKLIHDVHGQYFHPPHDEFKPRTFWALSNAFTGAVKKLTPLNQFQATGKVGAFLQTYWG